MAEETIASAMEPFRQLDGSLARKFEGAGLGLSIAKALIELHGGTLAITSEVGSGTTATLSLPAGRVTLARQPSDPRQPSSAELWPAKFPVSPPGVWR